MTSFYVYHLIDPRNSRVFYVGKGKGDRIEHHEREAQKGVDHPKCDVIRSIWADGMSVGRVKVAVFAEEQAAYDFEKVEIARIGLCNLTNIAPGGGRPWIYSVDDSTTVRAAKMLINVVARMLSLKASGKRLNYPWQDAFDAAQPKMVGDLIKKFGEKFVSDEFFKNGVKAQFVVD